ncbi:hypothetical protein SCNRRL3882_3345 [Streptomyces chartreusis NRRL 3882]|uniref:Uncharacterized protein n=1 Tax=Streptomyces chartreusis NRRL 3882 TaxID=1079985 RepID=A0A2N9B954_STRCX|nr:hypothetical protein SCNRRL3882_3345 [Streptomyces chartreusis NRRL 3882]
MANDSDLRVNVDLLMESESRLRKIKKEFKNLGNHRDDMRKHWGSGHRRHGRIRGQLGRLP